MAQWMPAPQAIAGCPPGLEYLSQLDQVLIHQQVELLEAFTGFETANKYNIKNSMGQQVFFAAEDSGCLERNCCGKIRSFEMRIMDNTKREVITIRRPLRLCSCCMCVPGLAQEMTVVSNGAIIGYVRQKCGFLQPEFDILDVNNQRVLEIEGPMCYCNCSLCGDVKYVVKSNGQQIGEIRKQWSGLLKEAFTDADNFGVTFPKDLAVTVKATLLAATFMIDFLFFESDDDDN